MAGRAAREPAERVERVAAEVERDLEPAEPEDAEAGFDDPAAEARLDSSAPTGEGWRRRE